MKNYSRFIIFMIPVLLLEPMFCNAQGSDRSYNGMVEITADDYSFEAPGEVPSGWSTFRMTNKGEETHFLFLTRLPEGKTFDDYMEEVAVHFVNAWYAIKSGESSRSDASEMLVSNIPKWFYSAVRMGGLGLIEAGGTTQVTLKLEPGNYFMECYMKTKDGEFHAMEGMARPLTVTTESSGALPPEADIKLTLSNGGIEITDELTPGQHTIAVHFAEHPEAGPQHDIHLARLDDETNINHIVHWMDWMNVDGFNTPAPTKFVGGVQEMPTGYTAYLTIELEAGRYAWISQLTASQGLVKEFTVEP